ncbi:MAG: extracellular solute-binding protein [Syntrophales bacterium]
MRWFRAIGFFFLCTLMWTPQFAEAAAFTPDIPDMAAAKREGTVTWYTSTPVEAAQKIGKLFEEQTGIKVQLFRSGGSSVLRRFQQEIDARKTVADLLTVSDTAAMSTLIKRDLLVPFRPKHFEKIPAEAKDPQGRYIAQRLNLIVMIARADKGLDMPKNWTDLADPKYKGKMVMPDPSFTANQLVTVGTLSRKYGWGFYEKLQANNIMIVQGNQQVSDTLKSGERLLAAAGSDSYAWNDREDGHKIQSIFPTDGAFVIPAPSAVIKGAPHPNAAKVFAEFMLSDAVQNLIPQEGNFASRADIKPPAGDPPLSKIKLMAVDYDYIEKESGAIKKKFNEIFQ